MGDVTLVVLPDQRHGDPLDPHGCVALTRGRKDIPQRPLDPCIGGRPSPAPRAQGNTHSDKVTTPGTVHSQATRPVNTIHNLHISLVSLYATLYVLLTAN